MKKGSKKYIFLISLLCSIVGTLPSYLFFKFLLKVNNIDFIAIAFFLILFVLSTIAILKRSNMTEDERLNLGMNLSTRWAKMQIIFVGITLILLLALFLLTIKCGSEIRI